MSYTNLQYSNNQNKSQPTNQPYRDRPHQNEPKPANQPNRERPLIKVTVIPNNSAETQTAKSRKCSHRAKVQSTVSNQENSIKAKNVYLVVAGRKREKIYELKTTGSAEFSNNIHSKDEDATIEQVTHFKKLISSLNMDKKKKKAKKKDVVQHGSKTSLVQQELECRDRELIFQDCACSNDVQSGSPKDVRLRKSRVKISGKIGLTDDDRYVLKCAATINDKPSMFLNVPQANHPDIVFAFK